LFFFFRNKAIKCWLLAPSLSLQTSSVQLPKICCGDLQSIRMLNAQAVQLWVQLHTRNHECFSQVAQSFTVGTIASFGHKALECPSKNGVGAIRYQNWGSHQSCGSPELGITPELGNTRTGDQNWGPPELLSEASTKAPAAAPLLPWPLPHPKCWQPTFTHQFIAHAAT